MRKSVMLCAAVAGVTLMSTAAQGQRGVGDPEGVARMAERPPVEAMSGTVTDMKIGRCMATTGRADTGLHLLVETPEIERLDLHLGPADVLAHVIEQVEIGETIGFEAFRTDAMPENAYVAKTLTLDDKTIHLRDDGLRPSWAQTRGGFRGGMRRGTGDRPERPGPCWW
ncbi:MAG: hypothetical protein EA405_03370 [Rhodospirillales bacterium]|nr:MAG: hypothetical protein EA405_03370 [Rhodospirillales bacterium]